MEFAFKQESKIIVQGDQLMINISKRFHRELKERHLLKKDLKINIKLSDDVDIS